MPMAVAEVSFLNGVSNKEVDCFSKTVVSAVAVSLRLWTVGTYQGLNRY
jgi:hypothetical protein